PSSIGDMASLQWLILQGRTYELAHTLKHPPAYEGTTWNIGYHQGKYYSNTNEFSGSIPPEIGNLSNLIALELSNAKEITGPIPSELGNLSNLKGLYLSRNNFTGHTLPSELGNLRNLKHFYISRTGIVGELPDSFQNLTQLTALMITAFSDADEIADANLTGSLPDLSGYTQLRRISLRGHGLTGEFPQYVNNGNFRDLNILILAGNELTGT
ncbi:leucine-rich repeat domain-containing protein, partial [Fodinibius salsisoli]|nr:hypothetical protein [Fodinibius salsisoli]